MENYPPPRLRATRKVDPGGDLSAFEAAVLEECIQGEHSSRSCSASNCRLVTEDEWFWTIAGNA